MPNRDLAPIVVRQTDGVPRVIASDGTALVAVSLVRGAIHAEARDADAIFRLPSLYVAAWDERRKWYRETMTKPFDETEVRHDEADQWTVLRSGVDL